MSSKVSDETVVDGGPDMWKIGARRDTLVSRLPIDRTDVRVRTHAVLGTVSLKTGKEYGKRGDYVGKVIARTLRTGSRGEGLGAGCERCDLGRTSAVLGL